MNKRPTIPFLIKKSVFERDKYRCVICGATNKDSKLHIDHIFPVSLGGTDEFSNLTTLCSSCNCGKGNAVINIPVKEYKCPNEVDESGIFLKLCSELMDCDFCPASNKGESVEEVM